MPQFSDNKLCISVREAVALAVKSGDIKNDYLIFAANTGTELHKKIQKEECAKNNCYYPEVSLSTNIKFSDCEIKLKGRADGILEENGEYTVDEIKSVISSLGLIDAPSRKLALCQAQCYAYMLASKKALSAVKIRLIYINSETEEKRIFYHSFSKEELSSFFENIISACHSFVLLYKNHITARNASIERLRFPFSPREGQKGLVRDIYKSISKGSRIYVNAPTGIGKTMSALFPAVKALNHGTWGKIFYLTSKGSLSSVAVNAVNILREHGANIKAVVLTAKNKICFSSSYCLPFVCDYARGYHDRIKNALQDAFANDSVFTRAVIEDYAKKYTVCPYELSLSLAEICDIVICDYNYIFEPKAEVKSNFDAKACILVDEAHNLVERVREIYSVCLSKSPFLKVKSIFKNIDSQICLDASNIVTHLKAMHKTAEDDSDFILYQPPFELYNLTVKFYDSLRFLMSKKDVRHALGELGDRQNIFYDISEILRFLARFIHIFNLFDDSYGAYIDTAGGVNLFCIDTSKLIDKKLSSRGCAVLFSATLTPDEYYTRMLAMSERDNFICIPSPFPAENFLVIVAKADTRLKQRENTLPQILALIHKAADIKVGNYIAFFPSYTYMKLAFNTYTALYPEHRIIMQREDLTEAERDIFLSVFNENPDNITIVFAVMGSILSEGIDLTGERLSGAFIVGIGIPQMCEEREMIRRYFDDKGEEGNNYAYIYPSANKVFQAGGRVIRSETDRGFLFLIDDRFACEEYLDMLPRHWNNYRIADGDEEAAEILKDFWNI